MYDRISNRVNHRATSNCSDPFLCPEVEVTIHEFSTLMNAALACAGWLFIMFKTGGWLAGICLRQWNQRRKAERQHRAVDILRDAFELDDLEHGSTVKITTRGDLTIMMFRKEGE